MLTVSLQISRVKPCAETKLQSAVVCEGFELTCVLARVTAIYHVKPGART